MVDHTDSEQCSVIRVNTELSESCNRDIKFMFIKQNVKLALPQEGSDKKCPKFSLAKLHLQ